MSNVTLVDCSIGSNEEHSWRILLVTSANTKNALAELPNFLEWQGEGEAVIEKACSYYVRWVYSALADLQRDYGVPYLTSVRALPSQQQQQLLLAPPVFQCLWNSGKPAQRARLASFISTEQLRAGLHPLSGPSVWSAIGDCGKAVNHCYVAGATADDNPVVRIGRILLDFGSPHALDHYPSEFGEISPVVNNRLDLSSKLAEGLAALSRVSTLAHKNLISNTQLFAVVDTPGRAERAIAMSTCELIGRMSVLNLHSNLWTTGKIMNSLVHESIHTLLYKLELQQPLYTNRQDAWRLQVTSPWSGRVLYLHSFVHACFVWFGLCNFWQLARPLHSDWEAFFSTARSGFSHGSPAECLSDEAKRCVQPLVLGLIDGMSESIERRF